MTNAYVTATTAALQWYVANTSAFIPAGVTAGGGTIPVATFVQLGVTVVQNGAAVDPLYAGYPNLFSPLFTVDQLTVGP
jgi:hypothetical protein